MLTRISFTIEYHAGREGDVGIEVASRRRIELQDSRLGYIFLGKPFSVNSTHGSIMKSVVERLFHVRICSTR